ncbi:MAG: SLC13 family permease [Gemmatales bacterium]|nr:GntP family permease [Gemmatales bacterium]MDW7994121.1 SLC13 family permease [Gemmatales bacterium]
MAEPPTMDWYPLVLLGLGIGLISWLLVYWRLNAFLALLLAALVVGLLSPRVIYRAEPGRERVLALERVPGEVARGFGETMGSIGIVIALATIVGRAMTESGSAERIVRSSLRLFGPEGAGEALLVAAFILGIPVFFDTVFLILAPLVLALALRRPEKYLSYIMAVAAGAGITHSLVPPTPGPLTVSVRLHVDLGLAIQMGVLVAAPLAVIGFLYGVWMNRQYPVPLRLDDAAKKQSLEMQMQRPDKELPHLAWALCPILLPLVLINLPTLSRVFAGNASQSTWWLALVSFAGERNIALLVSALVALWLTARQQRWGRSELARFTASALDEAGMILLITSAGGAFGKMLQHVGVGESISLAAQHLGIPVLVLAWGLTAMLKIAQGSATVAMITTCDIVRDALARQLGLPVEQLTATEMTQVLGYHPVYLMLAIGCGSKIGSWMNDSGFWVVCRASYLTEVETLRSWTIGLVLMGVAGLPFVWLLATYWPHPL